MIHKIKDLGHTQRPWVLTVLTTNTFCYNSVLKPLFLWFVFLFVCLFLSKIMSKISGMKYLLCYKQINILYLLGCWEPVEHDSCWWTGHWSEECHNFYVPPHTLYRSGDSGSDLWETGGDLTWNHKSSVHCFSLCTRKNVKWQNVCHDHLSQKLYKQSDEH